MAGQRGSDWVNNIQAVNEQMTHSEHSSFTKDVVYPSVVEGAALFSLAHFINAWAAKRRQARKG